jgi:hypothetical protein
MILVKALQRRQVPRYGAVIQRWLYSIPKILRLPKFFRARLPKFFRTRLPKFFQAHLLTKGQNGNFFRRPLKNYLPTGL